MMARTLHEAISVTAATALAEGRCSANEIALRVESTFPELVDAQAERLVHSHIRHIAKRVLRDISDEDEEQDSLPGLSLPVAIAVPDDEGEILYVRTDQATWAELQAGIWMRDMNIKRAMARRKTYLAALKRLQPYMEHDPTCTVADALRLENAA